MAKRKSLLTRLRLFYYVNTPYYVMFPWERFIFNTVMLILFYLILHGVLFYLPKRLYSVGARAYYYYTGRELDLVGDVSNTFKRLME